MGFVGFGDAAQADLVGSGRRGVIAGHDGEDDIGAFDFGQIGDEGSRRVAQPGRVHPIAQCFPERIGQKADQNVGQNAFLFVVPDRSNFEFVFGDSKGPFGFGQLDVSFPKSGGIDLIQVAAEQVATG